MGRAAKVFYVDGGLGLETSFPGPARFAVRQFRALVLDGLNTRRIHGARKVLRDTDTRAVVARAEWTEHTNGTWTVEFTEVLRVNTRKGLRNAKKTK